MSLSWYVEQAARIEALRATIDPTVIDYAISISQTSMLSFEEALDQILALMPNDEGPAQPEGQP